jgi:hypothetical protein
LKKVVANLSRKPELIGSIKRLVLVKSTFTTHRVVIAKRSAGIPEGTLGIKVKRFSTDEAINFKELGAHLIHP